MWRTARAVAGEITGLPATRPSVLSSVDRLQLAVAGEHRVGARELHQVHRDAVPVGHRRLLDRLPRLRRAQAARRPRRESRSSARAEARARRTSPTASPAAVDSAIFAAPTLDDFWITCSTVSAPSAMRVVDRCAAPMVSVPGAVWITVSGRTLPASSAAAIVNGFIVEPGSNMSVSARLRMRVARDLVAAVRVVGRPVGERQDLAGLRRRG